jgi:SAM-dependent methyltransferase
MNRRRTSAYTTRKRRESFSRRLLWTLYAYLWNSCSHLSPYRAMQNLLIRDFIPTNCPTSVLYLNYGTGDFEERIMRERGQVWLISANVSGLFSARARRRNHGNGAIFFKREQRKQLPINDSSQDLIICMDPPDPRLQAEIRRVGRPNARCVVVSPRIGADLRPIMAQHWRDACQYPHYLDRCKLIGRLLPVFIFYLLDKVFHINGSMAFPAYMDKDSVVLANISTESQFRNAGQSVVQQFDICQAA